MIFLNENQTQFVKSFLDDLNLKHQPFKEELLDHICTAIEEQMNQGSTFHNASNNVLDAFKEDELKEIQKQLIHSLNRKQLIMKKVSMLAIGFLFITSLLWSHNYDPPTRSPLDGDYRVTSAFGNRMHPVFKVKKFHMGIDFKAPIGTPVYATADGEIIKVQDVEGKGYGKMIMIKHDETYQSLYAQLSEISVEVGQKVEKGTVIGKTGNSGASTAPHLHYEVRKAGKADNPQNYLKP